jgi:hypothetical protein
MNKTFGLGLLIVGVILLIWGADASGSFGSGVSKAINGAPSDKTIWLIGAGVVVTLVGIAGFVRGDRSS